jgi:peroxiredoxin Q/BCP
MDWIRFDPQGRPAPSAKLPTTRGQVLGVADFRGRSDLVVFFSPREVYAGCRALVHAFAANADRLQELDTVMLVVVPGSVKSKETWFSKVRALVDVEGELWRQYSELVSVGEDEMMLFVLDRYTAPYAAWVGREPDAGAMYRETVEWLEYVELQCPE